MNDFDDILGSPLDHSDTRSEKAIQNSALVSLSALPNSIFWRHNTGQAWQGKRLKCRTGQVITVQPGMVVLAEARPIDFGLLGSGDIIGAVESVPVVVEVKDAVGRQRRSQELFEQAWSKAGGIYVLARSPADAVRKVRESVLCRNETL